MKRRLISIFTAALLALCLSACTGGAPQPRPAQPTRAETTSIPPETTSIPPQTSAPEENGETMIYAHIGEQTLRILPQDNASAAAFVELLRQGDLTVEMHDYGGFEKVGALGTTLPTNDEPITTAPGDVILYQGRSITIYYGENTWRLTRLGKVQDLTSEALSAALGDDPVVVFSLRAHAAP